MDDEKRTADATPAGPSRAATLLLVGAVLGAAVVIFAWMNTDAVPVEVFLWEPEISKALLMFVPLAIGFILGWGVRASRSRRKENGGGGRSGRGGSGAGRGGPSGG